MCLKGMVWRMWKLFSAVEVYLSLELEKELELCFNAISNICKALSLWLILIQTRKNALLRTFRFNKFDLFFFGCLWVCFYVL